LAKERSERSEEARKLYEEGLKLIEISVRLGVPEGTVRSWKNRYKWDSATLRKGKCNVAKKVGGQPGNKNAVGHGAPKQNKNAEKFGFFSKYLPEETREIFESIEQADPLDILWHQIQIAYAAIIRAQRIAYVKNQSDKTVEKIEEKDGNVIGEKWEVQQAWDKQNAFLKAQARAQGELRAMIKQYHELLHDNWQLASKEQKARIAHIQAQTERISRESCSETDDGVEIINDAEVKTDAEKTS